jgi:hypothetical protein
MKIAKSTSAGRTKTMPARRDNVMPVCTVRRRTLGVVMADMVFVPR